MKTISISKTHISHIRKENQSQIDDVCCLLGWSRQDYCQHQFEVYDLFIDLMYPDAEKLAKTVKYHKSYTGFFINEWMRRNKEQFMPFALMYLEDAVMFDEDGVSATEETLIRNAWVELNLQVGVKIVNDPIASDEHVFEEYLIIHSAKALFNDPVFCKRFKYMEEKLIRKI